MCLGGHNDPAQQLVQITAVADLGGLSAFIRGHDDSQSEAWHEVEHLPAVAQP